MARLAIHQAYEEARQAALDARALVEQRQKLLTAADDPAKFYAILRSFSPRCLAPDRREQVGALLRHLHDGRALSSADLRRTVRALTTMGRGRRSDLFVDAFVRSLARWWLAVTGEIPPLTRNPASPERQAAGSSNHFLDLLDAARADAGGPKVGLPDLTSAARRVGEAIRAEADEGRSGWTVGDATWSPRFEGALIRPV